MVVKMERKKKAKRTKKRKVSDEKLAARWWMIDKNTSPTRFCSADGSLLEMQSRKRTCRQDHRQPGSVHPKSRMYSMIKIQQYQFINT